MAKKYSTFEEYIEDVYYNEISEILKSHIAANEDRLGLSTYYVPVAEAVDLHSFSVGRVRSMETDNNWLSCMASIRTEISVSGRFPPDGSRYITDQAVRWFSVFFSALLSDGLCYAENFTVSDYQKDRYNENSLSKFMIPYISKNYLDAHAEKFLKKYCPRALYEPMALPIPAILTKMGLSLRFAPLPAGIFGQTYFTGASVDVFQGDARHGVVKEQIKPGTILVSPDNFFTRNVGSMNITVIHECVHADRHSKFFELQKLLHAEMPMISCAIVDDPEKGADELSKTLEWMEWQANALAPRIMIPACTGREKLKEIEDRLRDEYPECSRRTIMELAIGEFASYFQVSMTAARIRAVELGFEQAVGILNYVDGKRHQSYSFAPGSLKDKQSFIIDRSNAIVESVLNPVLAEEMQSGRFIYVDSMFVIKDPKYVEIIEGKEPALTEYALDHADECCLVFNIKKLVNVKSGESSYRVCFLCRDADSKSFLEATFDPNEGQNEDAIKRSSEMSVIRAEEDRLQKILAETPSSFCGTLDYHIRRRGYSNDRMEELTGISLRSLYTYRTKLDAKPTLECVMALCIGLNLQPLLAFDLISKAGYNIMVPTIKNMTYWYLVINHHMENIFMWNQKLKDGGINQQLPQNGNELTAITC